MASKKNTVTAPTPASAAASASASTASAAMTTSSQNHTSSGSSSAWKVVGQMIFCIAGIYGSYFIWGLLQEKISTRTYDLGDGRHEKFSYIYVINLMQSVMSLIVASAVALARILFDASSKKKRTHHHHHDDQKEPKSTSAAATKGNISSGETNPLPFSSSITSSLKSLDWQTMSLLGASMTFGSPFGYAAMRRMPYPVVITIKMAKMVPIILVGVLWHRTKYSREKYVICTLITAGIVWFSLLDHGSSATDDGKHHRSLGGRMVDNATIPRAPAADPSKTPASAASAVGVLLVLINLWLDGFTASSQDVLTRGPSRLTGNTLQIVSNMSCVLWSVVALVLFELLPANPVTQPELLGALHFFMAQPAAFRDAALMGVTNAVGQLFIFQTIALFGSLTLTAVTVTRKAGSVLLSIVIHGHVLSNGQIGALLLVLLGVVLEAWNNISAKMGGHGGGHHHHHHHNRSTTDVNALAEKGKGRKVTETKKEK